jgi:hypothetical protein
MAAGLWTKPNVMLRITAALEIPTGAALLLLPSLPVAILFGAPLDTALATIVARFAGVPLLCLGFACWRAADDRGGAGSALLTAMLGYDVVAAALLGYAGLALGLTGIGLWPAAIAHLALAVGCAAALRQDGRRRGSC